jgi:hypothetical protein
MLVRMLVWWLATLLLLHGLHSCLLLLGLLLEVLDELWDGHASFLGIASQLLLHGHDLFPGGHLPRGRHSRWWLCLHRDQKCLYEEVKEGELAQETDGDVW